MSDTTIQELFRNLERMVSDRLRLIDELLRRREPSAWDSRFVAPSPEPDPIYAKLLERISALEREVSVLRGPLIPQYPLSGIEVVPKKEVVLTEPDRISEADRLLLNPSALKALEKEEANEIEEAEEAEQEFRDEEEFRGEDEEMQVEEAEEAEEEMQVETEAEAEPEAEEEELEEFEYKGSTYYRDSDKNVFMADEEGELVATPIGVWSEVKKRIIPKKSE
jgi:hypothetical protein